MRIWRWPVAAFAIFILAEEAIHLIPYGRWRDAVYRAMMIPERTIYFPVMASREFSPSAAEIRGFIRVIFVLRAYKSKISPLFPAYQGIPARDPSGADCVAHHLPNNRLTQPEAAIFRDKLLTALPLAAGQHLVRRADGGRADGLANRAPCSSSRPSPE